MSDTQFTKPVVGKLVKLRVRYPSNYYYRTSDFVEEEYCGTVLPDERWTKPDAFVLADTAGGRYPVRDIPLREVIDLQYLDGTAATQQAVNNQVQTWSVSGSKGNNYTVTLHAGKYSCTCPGFGFRRHCKHIESVKS